MHLLNLVTRNNGRGARQVPGRQDTVVGLSFFKQFSIYEQNPNQ